MITRLHLCHRHRIQQLTCQVHWVEDHCKSTNNTTPRIEPYGMPLIMTWKVKMINKTERKMTFSMVNSHNKVVSGMLFKTYWNCRI